MKFTIAAVFAVFATSILAAPATFPTVTIQFSNDQTGANADVKVTANGNPNAVSTLFAGTSINKGGRIIATSAQLTQFVQGTFCVVKAGNTVIANLNTDKTFADLDGNHNAAIPTDVTNDVIICEV
jgi:hypothetical protein